MCAAIATAHGLYEVAAAAGVGWAISATYPAMTDGLAVTAYIAARTLPTTAGRVYAWVVVACAAGVSGLAQAAFLAHGARVTPTLAGWVGGWPAIAAVITAHLLYLLAPAAEVARARRPDLGPLAQAASCVPGGDTTASVEPPAAAAGSAPEPARLHLAPAVEPGGESDPVAKAVELLAAGAGRPTLARELGLKDHQARKLAEEPHRAEELLTRWAAP